uniref:Uncharacterized protein n=1 Tax=Utricularia reniformis TaxID=192314 RepID=A0A1Y0B4N5_9LAMI|nr:hypothetical protein AEK19_MT2270 [Utricularia reniformis]ART32415.1 hypothetical protein AEK19_MT2270 [Utricularia reniformis]
MSCCWSCRWRARLPIQTSQLKSSQLPLLSVKLHNEFIW